LHEAVVRDRQEITRDGLSFEPHEQHGTQLLKHDINGDLGIRMVDLGPPRLEQGAKALVQLPVQAHLALGEGGIPHRHEDGRAAERSSGRTDLEGKQEIGLDDLPDAGPFPACRINCPLHRGPEFLPEPLVEGVEQCVLVMEPPVEGAHRAARARRDIRDRGVSESLLLDHRFSRVEQALERALAPLLPHRAYPTEIRYP
jgi:hypothetical protein